MREANCKFAEKYVKKQKHKKENPQSEHVSISLLKTSQSEWCIDSIMLSAYDSDENKKWQDYKNQMVPQPSHESLEECMIFSS